MNDNTVSSPEIFKRKYDTFFNSKVKQALRNQDIRRLTKMAQGVMIGYGEIWISNITGNDSDVYKITSINYRAF